MLVKGGGITSEGCSSARRSSVSGDSRGRSRGSISEG